MATNWFERKRDKALFARVTYTAYVDGQPKEKQLIKRIDSLDDLPKAVYELKEKAKKLKDNVAPVEVNNRMSLNDYLDKWLADVEGTVCEATYDDYKSILERYTRPAIGKKQLAKIHYTDIKAIVNSMQKRGLSPRTIRYAHRVISMALKRATEPPWNLLPDNPARHVTKSLPKEEEKTRVWLSGEAAEKFLEALDGDRLGLMFEIALITGLRPEEYFALQWQRDVDLNRGTITVNEVLYRKRKAVPGQNSWYFKEPKTQKSRRTIPLPDYIVASLKTHKASRVSSG
jgi:integrase